MKHPNLKILVFISLFSLMIVKISYSQEGTITINQDERITELLELKKQMNRSDEDVDRYKIQIYSGDRISAEKAQSEFKTKIGKWSSKLLYETPNYKIWVGSFTTRLEADRALKDIKRKFSSAFILKPKKDKK